MWNSLLAILTVPGMSLVVISALAAAFMRSTTRAKRASSTAALTVSWSFIRNALSSASSVLSE